MLPFIDPKTPAHDAGPERFTEKMRLIGNHLKVS
jgi:hypothetical protein